MRGRPLIAAAIVVACALGLSACGGSTSGPPTSAPVAVSTVTVSPVQAAGVRGERVSGLSCNPTQETVTVTMLDSVSEFLVCPLPNAVRGHRRAVLVRPGTASFRSLMAAFDGHDVARHELCLGSLLGPGVYASAGGLTYGVKYPMEPRNPCRPLHAAVAAASRVLGVPPATIYLG